MRTKNTHAIAPWHRSHRYPTPFKSAGSTTPFWYSVDAGPAHIIFVRAALSPGSDRHLLNDGTSSAEVTRYCSTGLFRFHQCLFMAALSGHAPCMLCIGISRPYKYILIVMVSCIMSEQPRDNGHRNAMRRVRLRS